MSKDAEQASAVGRAPHAAERQGVLYAQAAGCRDIAADGDESLIFVAYRSEAPKGPEHEARGWRRGAQRRGVSPGWSP